MIRLVLCYILNLHAWKPLLRADWFMSQSGLNISSRMAWQVGLQCKRCGCRTYARMKLYLPDSQ